MKRHNRNARLRVDLREQVDAIAGELTSPPPASANQDLKHRDQPDRPGDSKTAEVPEAVETYAAVREPFDGLQDMRVHSCDHIESIPDEPMCQPASRGPGKVLELELPMWKPDERVEAEFALYPGPLNRLNMRWSPHSRIRSKHVNVDPMGPGNKPDPQTAASDRHDGELGFCPSPNRRGTNLVEVSGRGMEPF